MISSIATITSSIFAVARTTNILCAALSLTRNYNSRTPHGIFRHALISHTDKRTSSYRLIMRQQSSENSIPNNQALDLRMENLYVEWTLEEDKYLLMNSQKPIPVLAAQLGRGLRGVEARLAKLNDVNSPAYIRLVAKDAVQKVDVKGKLTPAKEVMRRIRWDITLSPSDFTVLYYDRVENAVMSSPFDAKNESVQGKEELFVFAIPEHRIMAFKYKERTVWDKEKRIDYVFGSMYGEGETINDVVENYSEWKRKKNEVDEHKKKREVEVVQQIKSILGDTLFLALKDLSNQLQTVSQIQEKDVADYVTKALSLFHLSKKNTEVNTFEQEEEETYAESASFNKESTTLAYLDMFSTLVALLDDAGLREMILFQIQKKRNLLKPTSLSKRTGEKQKSVRDLLQLDENDIDEKFVKGSGSGGQKINKTANKVILVHQPTQVRVECQDTRSLQANRKIAMKRLRLKVDEYLNGTDSIIGKKASKLASKKARAKAKARARSRARKQKKGEA